MVGSHDEIKESPAPGEPGMKKSYSTPKLIVHGAVERITEEQKGSGRVDGSNMGVPTHSR